MPQQLTPTAEALGPITVPTAGDPRDSGSSIRNPFQKLLNMLAGVQQSVTPTGTVAAFAGTNPPNGWLLCSGQLVSRTTYAALFGVLGATYGAGDGSTTFALPDLRGRAVLGVGQGPNLTNRPLGLAGGEEAHALTIQELPRHSHASPTPPQGQPNGGQYELPVPISNGGGYSGYDYNGSAPTDTTGGDTSHSNMQPFLALNYIIRS